MSQLQEIANEDAEMEMTPMIDVTFLLLIFFMCTLKFKTLEGKLAAYLPKDVGVNQTQAEPIEKVEIKVKVLEQGSRLDPKAASKLKSRNPSVVPPWTPEMRRWSYGSDRIVQYSVGPFKTTDLDKLEDRLKQQFKTAPKGKDEDGKPKDPPATIDPRGTVYEDVVVVLDAAMNAGFTEVTFVGSYE